MPDRASADPLGCIRTFQVGLEWFTERGGGLDRYYRDLVTLGHGNVFDIRGMVVGDGGAEAETSGRIVSFSSPSAPLAKRLRRARRALITGIADQRADLVATHFALHALPGLDRISQPLVVHFHGPWASEAQSQRGPRRIANEMQRRIERHVYRRADRVVVLSNAFARLVHERYGVAPEQIAVVPGSIQVGRFAQANLSRRDARMALGWPTDRPILLSVRRLVPRMGLENLIDAMAAVKNRHAESLLLIAGKGPNHDALATRIHALGLDRHVRLLGFVPDDKLPLIYRAADCSIVPTTALEGFGLVAAESLASGTPVIVTPVGGLPEIVAPLASSMVLEGSCVDDLANGISAWATGGIALPDAHRCSEYAAAAFSWDTGLQRLADQYRIALA